MFIDWTTDIHLNFLKEYERKALYAKINKSRGECLLIGGDIAEAHSLVLFLDEMKNYISKDIYYVLGNHDYYGSDFDEVKNIIFEYFEKQNKKSQKNQHKFQCFDFFDETVSLTEKTVLIGNSGWGDAGYGNFMESNVQLSDYFYIKSLKNLSKIQLQNKLQNKGIEFADYLKKKLEKCRKYKTIIYLTHVPPFENACWYNGQISDSNFLPHFSCAATGNALIEYAEKNLHQNIIVLCGHTHGDGFYKHYKNISVFTNGSDYYKMKLNVYDVK